MSDLKHTPEQTLAAVKEYEAAMQQATMEMVADDRTVDAWVGAVNEAATRISAKHGMTEAYLEAAWNAWSRSAKAAA